MRQRLSVQPGMSHLCRALSVYWYSGAIVSAGLPGCSPCVPMRASLRALPQPSCMLHACAAQLSPIYMLSASMPLTRKMLVCTLARPRHAERAHVSNNQRDCAQRFGVCGRALFQRAPCTLTCARRPEISQRPCVSVCLFCRTSTIFHRQVGFGPNAPCISMDCMIPRPRNQLFAAHPNSA